MASKPSSQSRPAKYFDCKALWNDLKSYLVASPVLGFTGAKESHTAPSA